MTFMLAKSIAYFFMKKEIIPQDKLDEYVFGFEILLSDLLILMLIFLISVLTKTVLESTMFLISFITLRRQTGGFHAKNHLNCNIIFVSTFLIYLMILFYLPYNMRLPFSIGEIIISSILVFLLAPIEHPNNPVSRSKYNRCRKNSIIILSVQCAAIIALIFINRDVAISAATGMCSVAIYLLAQCIKSNHGSKFKRKGG